MHFQIRKSSNKEFMLREILRGTGVALVTPFKQDKNIDYDALQALINFVIEGGVQYVVTLGTTGETPTISREEKLDIINATFSAVAARVPVVIGIGGNNTQSIIKDMETFPIENATASSISVDGSGVYVVGNTQVNLPGATKVGPSDWATPPMFLRKYEPAAGSTLYTVQFGIGPAAFTEGGGRSPPAVNAVDVFSGSVYVAGGSYPPDAQDFMSFPGYRGVFASILNATDGSMGLTAFKGCGPGSASDVDAGPHGIFVSGGCFVEPGAAISTGAGYIAKLDGNTGNWTFFNAITDGGLHLSNVSGMSVRNEGEEDGGIYATGLTVSQDTPDHSKLPPQYFLKKFDFDGHELSSMEVQTA